MARILIKYFGTLKSNRCKLPFPHIVTLTNTGDLKIGGWMNGWTDGWGFQSCLCFLCRFCMFI